MATALTQRVLGMRRDEVRRAWPLALAYGLAMAALYVLKPVRNALFLDRFDVADLPYVLLVVAVMGAAAAVLYARIAADVRLDRLLPIVVGTFVVSLLGFRWALPQRDPVVVFAFYVWVALYGLIATSLLWQLANARFTARQARRVFGLIGVGGIAGAVCGGVLTGWAASAVGSDNLLLVAGGLLALSWPCMRIGAPGPELKAPEHTRAQGIYRDLRDSELLRAIVVTAALVATVSVIADVQFNEVIQRAYPGTDDKAAFFGTFFASLNLLAIVIQLAVTPWLLTRFGVGAGLMVLPLALGLGTLALVLAPGLITGVLPKLADGGLRHSVHKAAAEILFIPMPRAVTKRSKLFVDATVDAFFTGVGALVVLVLTTQIGLSYDALGLVTLPLVGFWLGYVMRVRQAYVGAFRAALARRELDVSELRINISEASTVDALIRALQSRNPRQVRYALDMLTPVADERLGGLLPELLHHADSGIRSLALRVLAGQRLGDPAVAEPLLRDPDQAVRLEAAHYLCVHGETEPLDRLREMLRDPDPVLRSAALGCIAQYGGAAEYALLDRELVEGLLALPGIDGELVRVHVAKTLQGARGSQLQSLWPRLQVDDSEAVVRQAIESAGASPSAERLPWLLSLLDDKRFRMDARLALARYGASIIDELDRLLRDPGCSARVRRTLPRILARIDDQRSVDVLLAHVHDADQVLLRAIVFALDKLRRRFPALRFDDPRLDALLDTMLERHALHAGSARALEQPPEPGRGSVRPSAAAIATNRSMRAGRADAPHKLLLRSLREKRDEELRWLLMLLGLRHGPDDMGRVLRALLSGNTVQRGNGLEFLDNVLQGRPEHRVLARLEPIGAAGTSQDVDAVLRRLSGCDDPWLRACALYTMHAMGRVLTQEVARAARDDGDAIVRETAQMVLAATGVAADVAASAERAE